MTLKEIIRNYQKFSFYRINTSFIKTLDVCEILFEKFLRIMRNSFH